VIGSALASRAYVARLCREASALGDSEQRLVDEAASYSPAQWAALSPLARETIDGLEAGARLHAQREASRRERAAGPFRRASRAWLTRGAVPGRVHEAPHEAVKPIRNPFEAEEEEPRGAIYWFKIVRLYATRPRQIVRSMTEFGKLVRHAAWDVLDTAAARAAFAGHDDGDDCGPAHK